MAVGVGPSDWPVGRPRRSFQSCHSHGARLAGAKIQGLVAMLGMLVALCLWIIFGEVSLSLAAIRMLMMDVPSPTNQGESVELICSYELDEDKLYSVKWYKDDVEFYRYVPNDWPPGQFLPLQGVKVDLSKSGSLGVYLVNVDLNSAGVYRCEVSAEAPEFQTVEAEKEMKVLVLPTEGPRIIGGLPKYRVGDTVSVNCTSSSSKPAATLNWYINDEIITGKKESGYETDHFTVHHSNGLESSSLSLKFVVREHHFKGGNMKLKCTATISRVYTMSNEELVFRQQNSGLHILENTSRVRNSCSRPFFSKFLQIVVICFLLKKFTEIMVYSLRTRKNDNLDV